MAYNPTEWRDRVVERPRTYSLQDNGDGTYTLLPMPGNIIEPGTPVNAVNMNKIEQGIADTSQSLEQHINANTGVHGATPNAIPSRIVMRDGNGRAAVANPVNNDHIANKQYVDNAADAAEQAAIEWAQSFGLGTNSANYRTATDLNQERENGWVRVEPSTANIPSSGFAWGFCRIETRASTAVYQTLYRTDTAHIRIWTRKLSDGEWTPWYETWTEYNLPSPAQKDGTLQSNLNAEMLDGMRATSLDTPDTIMRRDSQGGTRVRGIDTTNLTISSGGNRTLWFVDADGNNRGLLFHNESSGSMILRVYDTPSSYRELSINPTTGLRYQGNDVWHTGNQGNPNNLNTSSKQIVGAINELFTTVSDGKQAIRDAIADAGGTPPSGSPDQYTHQDLADAISTVRKHAKGSTPAQTNVQIRGINFDANVLTGDYQTSDDGFVAFTIIYFPEAGGFSRLFVNKSSTTAADPIITKVSGGFNITLDRPAGTSFDWEAWGGRP